MVPSKWAMLVLLLDFHAVMEAVICCFEEEVAVGGDVVVLPVEAGGACRCRGCEGGFGRG